MAGVSVVTPVAAAVSAVVSDRVRLKLQGRWFDLSEHALERYRERCWPWGSSREARAELEGLLGEAEISLVAPEWARLGLLVSSVSVADEFVSVVSRQLVFPVRRGVMTTCVVPHRVGAQIRWRS